MVNRILALSAAFFIITHLLIEFCFDQIVQFDAFVNISRKLQKHLCRSVFYKLSYKMIQDRIARRGPLQQSIFGSGSKTVANAIKRKNCVSAFFQRSKISANNDCAGPIVRPFTSNGFTPPPSPPAAAANLMKPSPPPMPAVPRVLHPRSISPTPPSPSF